LLLLLWCEIELIIIRMDTSLGDIEPPVMTKG